MIPVSDDPTLRPPPPKGVTLRQRRLTVEIGTPQETNERRTYLGPNGFDWSYEDYGVVIKDRNGGHRLTIPWSVIVMVEDLRLDAPPANYEDGGVDPS